MAGYSVGIGSETKAFKQGFDAGVIEPIQDAQKELLALGRNRGPDQLEQSMKDAQRSTEQLKTETKQTADAIEREYRQSYRAAKQSADDFGAGASENVASFKEEAVQNFSEVASSFSGDMSDMADGVQGLTGGLASALTPGIGIPVAVLGAAAAAFFANWQQKTEATKQLVSDMYDDMTASGESFLSQDFIQQGIAKVYKDQYDDVKKRHEELGASAHTIAAAMAGDEASINQLLDARNAKRDAEIAQAKELGGGWREVQGRVMEINSQYQAQTGWLDDLAVSLRDTQGQASESNAATSDYLLTTIRNAKTATDEVDKFGNHLVTLPNGKQIFIDAQTGQARYDISAFKGDLDGKVPTQKTTRILADTRPARAALQSLRAEMAKPITVAVNWDGSKTIRMNGRWLG